MMNMDIALKVVKEGAIENFMEYGFVTPMCFFVCSELNTMIVSPMESGQTLEDSLAEMRKKEQDYVMVSEVWMRKPLNQDDKVRPSEADDRYDGIMVKYYEHGKGEGSCIARIIRDEEVDRVDEWQDLIMLDGKAIEAPSKN